MRREAAFIVLLSACSFNSSSSSGSPGSGSSTPDAATTTGDASPVGTEPSAFCDKADPRIIGCWEFEGNANDGSVNNLNTHVDNVTYVPSTHGMAMAFDDSSDADVLDSDVLNVESLTIEAWIKPTRKSDGTSYILDADGQYALQLKADGNLHCTLVQGPGMDTTEAAGPVVMNQWAHVACTYDKATGAGAIYVNGNPLTTGNGTIGKALSDKGDHGVSLLSNNNPDDDQGPGMFPPGHAPPDKGQRLTGQIDQLRLMNVARSAAEICIDTGRTDCPQT